MSKISEFGGGDGQTENDVVQEYAKQFMKSLKNYCRVRSHRQKELNYIDMIMQECKNELMNTDHKIKREQKQQFAIIFKLLAECEEDLKLIEDRNEQISRSFEAFVKHEQLKLQGIQDNSEKISCLLKDFSDSTQAFSRVNNEENNQLISDMCEKLQEMYSKYIVQQKKAKLESFVKKLIQEEDLF